MARILTVAALAEALGAPCEGDGDIALSGAAHPAEAQEGRIAIAMSPDFAALLPQGGARTAVVAADCDWRGLGLDAAILVARPRYALAHVTTAFAEEDALPEGVHASAVVEPGAQIGEGCRIGPFVHIAADARLDDGCRVHSGVSIGSTAHIGSDSLIHPGVRIGSRVVIGARAILHPNAVIGADGFSFVTPQPGAVEQARSGGGSENRAAGSGLVRIHSLAAVTVGDDVEIGAGATIDRGTLRDTRIGDGTKIDNLVQVGHNVRIGAGCMLCAQVGLAGSAEIGDRVVLGGKAGVADHVKVGSDVLVGAGSGVAANVKPRSIVMGYPAMPRDEAVRSVMAIRRLPRLFDTVDALKKRLAAMDSTG